MSSDICPYIMCVCDTEVDGLSAPEGSYKLERLQKRKSLSQRELCLLENLYNYGQVKQSQTVLREMLKFWGKGHSQDPMFLIKNLISCYLYFRFCVFTWVIFWLYVICLNIKKFQLSIHSKMLFKTNQDKISRAITFQVQDNSDPYGFSHPAHLFLNSYAFCYPYVVFLLLVHRKFISPCDWLFVPVSHFHSFKLFVLSLLIKDLQVLITFLILSYFPMYLCVSWVWSQPVSFGLWSGICLHSPFLCFKHCYGYQQGVYNRRNP